MSFIEEKGLENGKNGFEGRPLLYNPLPFCVFLVGEIVFLLGESQRIFGNWCLLQPLLEVQYSTFFPFNFLVYFCIQSTGNTDNEDICYEFKQEQDLIHRTHLYYMDYDFSPVSIQSVTECSTKDKQFFLSVMTGPCLFIQIINFYKSGDCLSTGTRKKYFLTFVSLAQPSHQ